MEKKLISTLLTSNNNMKYYFGKVTPEMFKDPICKDSYHFFLKCFQLGVNVDAINLKEQLEVDYGNQEITDFLKELLQIDVLGESEKNSLCKYIVNRYKGQLLYETCSKASYTAKDIDYTLKTILRKSEELLENKESKGHSIVEISERYKDYYGHDHPEGLRVGLYELDEIILGLEKGNVYILGARPAVGKSALSTQILTNIAEKGHKVAYFNLEMTEQQIYERIISRYSGISIIRLKKARAFMTEEQAAITKAVSKINTLNGLYIFSGSYSVSEMKFICKGQGFDLVVVDYLQLIKPDNSYSNRVSEVGYISKGLKELSMDSGIPVLALSQLSRKSDSKDEPTLNDLRESGDIEQDASVVMLMWNISDDGKVKGLKIDKNRQGNLGKVALQFEGDKMQFRTINHKSFEQTVKDYSNGKKYTNDPFQ